MFEIAAALVLALIYAIIIGVRKGAHKEGPQGMISLKDTDGPGMAYIQCGSWCLQTVS